MAAPDVRWIRHPDGVTTVDAEYVRPGFASVHVLQRGGKAALIDTGTNSSAPLIVRALEQLGIPVSEVELLFLTHVHLDHAGGTGLLLQELPNARVVAHPRAVPHLIDPARLESATIAVYGQRAYEQMYGKLLPVPRERISETRDGDLCPLGTAELTVLHTPGHALHHHVLFDPELSALFTGDTFGLSYPELTTEQGPYIVPTTTPTQFDPEQLIASIERLAALQPASIYLTHFGRVSGAERLARALREQIQSFVQIAQLHAQAPGRQQCIQAALRELVVARVTAHGVSAPEAAVDRVLGADLELNAQGLVAWLEREQKLKQGAQS
jgi:glyoxylase-like metal-dependent hydrolase (beta-lactamase superfamily II)